MFKFLVILLSAPIALSCSLYNKPPFRSSAD
nr:MAG TPA: hypothetical protein [Caudoviricetes sp.]